jgi:hypothetical protein
MVTPMIHTTAAKRVEVNSTSIEIPTARKAALVDGHAARAGSVHRPADRRGLSHIAGAGRSLARPDP